MNRPQRHATRLIAPKATSTTFFKSVSMLALAATVEVARHSDTGPVSCATVSNGLGLQERRLEAILRALAKGGILKSVRGIFGGYKLARDACSITVADIFKAAETVNSMNKKMAPTRSAVARMAVVPAVAVAENVFAAALARVTLETLLQANDLVRAPIKGAPWPASAGATRASDQ